MISLLFNFIVDEDDLKYEEFNKNQLLGLVVFFDIVTLICGYFLGKVF